MARFTCRKKPSSWTVSGALVKTITLNGDFNTKGLMLMHKQTAKPV
jgi:hypothetical protein